MKLNDFLSKEYSIPLTIFLCVILTGIFSYFIIGFIKLKTFNLEIEQQKLIKTYDEILNHKNKFDDINAVLADIEQRYQSTNKSLPDLMYQGEFVDFIQSIALDNHIQLSSINPNEPQTVSDDSNLIQLSIDINFIADFSQLINFLKTIENCERITEIKNFSIISQDNGDKLSCKFTLIIFSLDDRN